LTFPSCANPKKGPGTIRKILKTAHSKQLCIPHFINSTTDSSMIAVHSFYIPLTQAFNYIPTISSSNSYLGQMFQNKLWTRQERSRQTVEVAKQN